MRHQRLVGAAMLALGILLAPLAKTEDVDWQDIPAAQWSGPTALSVPALKRPAAAALALPAKEAQSLAIATAEPQPAGLYEVRLTLRPSHVGDAIAFHTSLQVVQGEQTVASFGAEHFARVHQPETRCFQLVHAKAGPLTLALKATCDAAVAESAWVAAKLKQGGPQLGEGLDKGDDDGLGLDIPLEVTLSPDRAVYFLVDRVDFRRLSASGQVVSVEVDKIRYLPGDTLRGQAVIADVGGNGGSGMLNLYLEHRVAERVKVQSLPVTLAAEPQGVAFELPLPERELGYALVAEYVSANGADRSEAAEYFNIATNFTRVAIFGGGLATRDAVLDEETIRRGLAKARAEYFNASEYFAWAEDDMVAMSPEEDFWSSGQTNYRMHKQTIQRQIRLAHEQGFAVATYGKFVMSGLKGWETAYDYPADHRRQYFYPVGMWEGVNVGDLDRRRDAEFSCYSKSPRVPGSAFATWWSTFMPINPDATPRMARIAAEECARSVAMFGWDAIRWDGHPRGAGWVQCGRSGKYEAWAARQTQSLVRYFKEIVGKSQSGFRHGYNYLLIEKDKGYDWAVEDYELDELCRDGGLIMNESIGNASAGWTFDQIARNLQVDGDLCRERGGCYLGISFASRNPPRDIIIESALWAAAGCRPYNDAMSREVRRYCTRYSQYTLDERLRRLATPEKVLAPVAETRLWWQPFVYETPLVEGRRQLVINLLNLPREATRPAREGDIKPVYDMLPGTDPVAFALTLPDGVRATAVKLIDPLTLEVTPQPLIDGRFEVPAIASWRVAIIELAVTPEAPSLAALYGPPVTFGVRRPGVTEEARKPEVVLDPSVEIWEVNKRIGELAPEWDVKRDREQAALDALTGPERDAALLARRQPVEALAKEWWKGAAIPADLALAERRPDFGDLTPQRNGRFDIFYGRGALDYRLRLPLAFARLDRFRVHDAWLWGAVRQGPHMGLAGNVPAARYPEFDLLLFAGIPHCAIGVENSYGLVDYVKAGGAVFFTGGEYAFGKGGYMHTILDRELLPLQCTGMVDTVTTTEPRTIEPGPDFAELGVAVDFAVKPGYWVRNEVVLRAGAKLFLKSGERPILVGWQLGKGRVVCLLVDHRGKSEAGVTAFFDWEDWPRLVEAAMRWAAPEAGATVAPASAEERVKALLAKLEESGIDDLFDNLDAGGAGGGLDLPGAGKAAGVELTGEALKQRLALVEEALALDDPRLAPALATQLATVGNLPLATRLGIVPRLQRERPANAKALAEKALASNDSALRGSGYLLQATSGDPAFARTVATPRDIPGETGAASESRRRDLVLAIVLYPGADLREEGERRVAAWNRDEQASRAAFAQVVGDDTALLDTSTYLDADAILARLAWLAYLARHDPAAHGQAFLREWLMAAKYAEYSQRTAGHLIDQRKLEGAVAEATRQSWNDLAQRFRTLQELTRPEVDAYLAADPVAAGAVLAEARFALQRLSVVNLLGERDQAASTALLRALLTADQPDLAAFARARLAE